MSSHLLVRPIISACLIFSAVGLSACEEKNEEAGARALQLRAIKTMVLKDRAADQIRRISGIVDADTVTDLSFEASGQITKINLDVGDFVDKGQIIAELDQEPFRLRLDTARGELDQAKANVKDAKKKFEQQSVLRKKGFTTKTNLDTATANLEVAESQLKVAKSRVSISERDLRKTSLIAPFRGRISEKYFDVFADVQAGQKIVQMHSEGELNVKVSVPEGLVGNFNTGDNVSVTFPTLENLATNGTIDEIGSRAGAANAFPIKVSLDTQMPELRPGITAEVTFSYATGATGAAFVVPNTALLPSPKKGTAYVFVYDKKTSTVKRQEVKVINLSNNELEIESDLKAGDIIATAGVSFLNHGMKVKLWKKK